MDVHTVGPIIAGIDESWDKIIDKEHLAQVLITIINDNITPKPNMVLDAFRHFTFDEMKVIIVAQDPYPTIGEAHGLAFSSKQPPIPKSLISIYKCLHNTGMIADTPATADLTNWAKQGVLLLNKSLTTIVGKRESHMAHWDDFTDDIVQNISMNHPGPLHFMLWGKVAKSLVPLIDQDKHKIYKQVHPSPMVQCTIKDPDKKFINCQDFKNINKILQVPINWDPRYTESGDNIKKVHWYCKHNGIDTDPRSLTSWVGSYKTRDGRVFVGGVVPFGIDEETCKMVYNNPVYAKNWVRQSIENICNITVSAMILSENARLKKYEKCAAKCKRGVTIIFD